MRLNERAIKALNPPMRGNRVVWDDEISGFGVRVTAGGARSFVLNYRVNGRERRMTIGAWPDWSATGARERAKELKREVNRGEDPLGEKQQLLRDPTFGDLAQSYLDVEAAKQKNFSEYKRMLEKEALPKWKNVRAADVRRRDVIELIEKKAETAPIVANRLFELVRRVYNFGIRRDLVESNPCVLVRPPGEEQSKDRVLSEDEIRVLWTALDGPGFSAETAAAMRMILATAQRPGEVAGMTRDEIDGEWWTIPAERSKNGLAHRVPLTKLAREIIKKLPAESPWLFPSPRQGRPIHRSALSHAIRLARQERDGKPPLLALDDFTAHDLRRSAASHMAAAGVERFVIGLVLNHSQPGITRIYDRYGYDAEKRKALETWERRLRRILTGKTSRKVVSIR